MGQGWTAALVRDILVCNKTVYLSRGLMRFVHIWTSAGTSKPVVSCISSTLTTNVSSRTCTTVSRTGAEDCTLAEREDSLNLRQVWDTKRHQALDEGDSYVILFDLYIAEYSLI